MLNPTRADIIADIDAGEGLIGAKAAARLAPFAVDGKSCHVATIYRAFDPGWLPQGGGPRVRLEFVTSRAGRATTAGSIRRFMRRLSAPVLKEENLNAAQLRVRRELAAIGL